MVLWLSNSGKFAPFRVQQTTAFLWMPSCCNSARSWGRPCSRQRNAPHKRNMLEFKALMSTLSLCWIQKSHRRHGASTMKMKTDRSSFGSMPSAQEFCWDWWLTYKRLVQNWPTLLNRTLEPCYATGLCSANRIVVCWEQESPILARFLFAFRTVDVPRIQKKNWVSLANCCNPGSCLDRRMKTNFSCVSCCLFVRNHFCRLFSASS